MACWPNPSRWFELTGERGRLIGSWSKFGPPSRVSWVSRYHTSEWMPATGFQWNFTKVVAPVSSERRKAWTPKPSMVRYERGMPRSDMTHISMWVDSGVKEAKSQNVSCALWA